jgi:hypothetical protein
MSIRQKKAQLQADLEGGNCWVFMCFTPQDADKCRRMLAGLFAGIGQHHPHVRHLHFPPGVLLAYLEECHVVTVLKCELPQPDLLRGLRTHFGYERVEATSDVFTLGIDPEDDAAMALGLLSRPARPADN